MRYKYYALTTENVELLGWTILAEAPTRRDAENAGAAQIIGMDMSATTRRKNLRVVSRTMAIRRFSLKHPLACGCCEMLNVAGPRGTR